MREKESYDANDISLTSDIFFAYSNGKDVPKLVLDLVFKFDDDLMVNEFGIVILLRHVWVFVVKRESFEKGRREKEIERKRKHRDILSV